MEPRGRGRAQRGGRARGGDSQQSTVRPGQPQQQRGGGQGDQWGPSRGGQGGSYRGGQQQGGEYRGGQQSGDYRGQQQGGDYNRGGQRGGQQGGDYRGGQRGGQQGGNYRGGQQGGDYRGGQQGGGEYRGGPQQGGYGRSQAPRPQQAPQQSAWGQQRPGPPQGQSQWPQPQQQRSQPPTAWGKPQGATQQYSESTQHPVQGQDRPKYQGRGQEGGDATASSSSDRGAVATASASGASGPRERGGGNGGVRGRMNRGEVLHTMPSDYKKGKMGVSGRPITLTANFFELIEHASWHLIQYEVKFSPDNDDTRVRKKLMYTAFKDEPAARAYIFDGSSLFTPIKINPDPLEKHVQDDTQGPVKVTIKQCGVLGWGDYTYIQVFNLVIRKCLALMGFELLQRNYFDAQSVTRINEYKLMIWPGYFTSIRQYEQKIMMNVDLSFKVMRKENCYDVLLSCRDRNDRVSMDEFKRKLIGSVVLTYYNNKTYKVSDIDERNSPLSTFEKKDGTRISYKQYYFERYNLNIQVDNQPLLISKASRRELRAGMSEIVVLVPELCQLTGLSDEQRTNFKLMSVLATQTRIAPKPRQAKLLEFIDKLAQNPQAMHEIKKWDLKLANNLVKLKGRVLPNEVIQVAPNMKTQTSYKADWMNSCKNGMLDRAPLDQLVVIHPNSKEAQNFMNCIQKVSQGMGWRLPRCQMEVIARGNVPDYLNALDKIRIQKGVMTLCVCIVPNKNAERYNSIKKRCLVEKGIPSQVITERIMTSKGVMSVASKIAIQMNCKLGGTPWSVGVPLDDVMVVGFDVCRDTLNKNKSFGGMVASMNNILSRYYSQVTEHAHAEEISPQFAMFMLNACEMYRKVNKRLPSRIMIYRDGVGDGQIPYVAQQEVSAIKALLKSKLYNGQETLKICTIVVTKRINTRLFHGDENPPPGTVVDDVITNPQRFDFFLVPQCVNQGTVTPTHYNIVDAENLGLDPDRIQILTYKLCHLYFNWSGTIRVPAPCQYAHKLAFLTSQSLHRAAHPSLDTLLYFL